MKREDFLRDALHNIGTASVPESSAFRSMSADELNTVSALFDFANRPLLNQVPEDRTIQPPVNPPQATEDEISIHLKFRDADGDSRTIDMNWAYLQLSPTTVSHWFQSRKNVIGDSPIDVALVEISRNGTVERHELLGKRLSKLEEIFQDLAAPTTPAQVEA